MRPFNGSKRVIRTAPAVVRRASGCGIRPWRIVALAAVLSGFAHDGRAADMLPEIIANVRANEELYRNVEVVATHTLRPGNPLLGHPRNFVITQDTTYRLVFQKDRFYFKLDSDGDVGEVGKRQRGLLSGFDGEHTRIALKDSICNLNEGRTDDPQAYILLPHTMLLRRQPSWVSFPLSVYLGGTKTIRSYPMYRDANLTMEYVREEVKEGLRTYLLRGTFWIDGWDKSWGKAVLRLWLAPDRNYLPVRLEWDKLIIKDHPQVIAWVNDLREIAPSVWFPFHYHCDCYDENWYEKDKSIVINDTEEINVKLAKLNPTYGDDLFRDIPFHDGAHVYVVKNGKILRSYYQGGEKFAPPAPRRSLWPVGIGALVVMASAVPFVLYRRARRRAGGDHGDKL